MRTMHLWECIDNRQFDLLDQIKVFSQLLLIIFHTLILFVRKINNT